MKNIRHILCATDFSTASEKGLAYASALARHYHASLHLTHVVSPMIGDGYTDFSAVLQSMEQQAVQQLTRMADTEKNKGIPTTFSVRQGSIIPSLQAETLDHDIQLVVMGSHGYKGFQRWLLGSVAESALRSLSVPMLLINASAPSPLPSLSFQRVLVTTDFSEGTAPAFELAFQVRRDFGAHLKVFHVIPPEPNQLGEMTPRDMSQRLEALIVFFKQQLQDLVAKQYPEGSDTETVVEIGVPFSAILATIARDHTDLLIINIHGKGFLDRALLGSTAERVIRGTPCPILAVPSPTRLASRAPDPSLEGIAP